ncbi:7-carboxy-7-deazaguanine synthase QueE [bacterium]|nr:7-carboxy-7-deazaguanine synthase QueE [bacterium]
MSYKINEIFDSWQGEGFYTGTPCTFVRLAGCNLQCSWCDTDHKDFIKMSASEIAEKCNESLVVITGGEPTIQNLLPLITCLKDNGKKIAIETNGTNAIPLGFDWIAIAPKMGVKSNREILKTASEIKIVVDDSDVESVVAFVRSFYDGLLWLQPEGNKNELVARCLEISKKTGERVGHQMHKIRSWK